MAASRSVGQTFVKIDFVEQIVFDQLSHHSVNGLDCVLATVFGRLGQFVFIALFVRIHRHYESAASCQVRFSLFQLV